MRGAALCLVVLVLALGAGARAEEPAAKEPAKTPRVVINGRTLPAAELAEFVRVYRVEPVAGDYWYDAKSGLYGVVGQPAAGFMFPGHELGKLAPDASRGRSGVFLNGRQLPQPELLFFTAVWGEPIPQGRYWLDGQGDVGYEGMPMPVGNLYARAQVTLGGGGGGGGGDNFWSSRFSAGNYTDDNRSGYVSVPGHGPVGYGLD